jgi:hypothetical protein
MTTDTYTATETLFSIEDGHSMWYIDFDREENIYKVCKDEHFRCVRKSLGEALEFIFDRIGSTSLKILHK